MAPFPQPSRSHHAASGGFANPWPPLLSPARAALVFLRLPVALQHTTEGQTKEYVIRTVQADFDEYGRIERKQRTVAAMALGHAGFLLSLPTTTTWNPTRILFDPIFGLRASPSTYAGPKRRLPAPCKVEDLPQVRWVVVSHNHYDHLDASTLGAIWRRAASAPPALRPCFLVPLGVAPVLIEAGIPAEHVREMDWWESMVFHDAASGENDAIGVPPDQLGQLHAAEWKTGCEGTTGTRTVFTCVPAQHNSGRGVLDQNKSLWAGWVVRQVTPDGTITAAVYFAGDTGYVTADGPCPAFKEIGDRLGPFDLAMVPIWRGASLSFLGKLGLRLTSDDPLASLHATPEHATLLARDARARAAVAMHCATFTGGEAETREALQRLAAAQGGRWRWEDGEGREGDGEGKGYGSVGAVDIGRCIAVECATRAPAT